MHIYLSEIICPIKAAPVVIKIVNTYLQMKILINIV